MKASEIVNALRNRKGQHVLVKWQRVAATLKDCPLLITKRTSAYVRAGIAYANLAVVKEAIANGERGEVEQITWAEWIQYPFILRHKRTMQEYVRLYPASFDNLKAEVEWSIDGKPATYGQVEPYLLAKEKHKDNEEAPLCFTLKAEDVIDIPAEA